jgi:hypothetical protein
MSANKDIDTDKESVDEIIEAVPEETLSEQEDVFNDEKVEGPKRKRKFSLRSLLSTKKRKLLTIIIATLVLLAVIFAIPFTRYAILSPFVKKDVTIKIVDSKTKRPVTNLNIELGGVSSQTNKDGLVELSKVPVGQYDLKVAKQYYKTSSVGYTVPVFTTPQSPTVEISATGRQVSVKVTNKVTGAPVDDVVIEASGTEATTAGDGLATIILPSQDGLIKAHLMKEGYISADVELKVDDNIVNNYSVTPAGSIYYLSKATGKINVMKSNLDGTNASIAVAATGQESDYETSLLSSRDWQYSVLSATRTDNKQRLYLVDSAKNELSVLDEGDATFNLVGWSEHTLVYSVVRNTANYWDNKRQALKSFNADTRKVTTLDETSGAGTGSYNFSYENFSQVYILKGELVYMKNWSFANYYYPNDNGDKVPALYAVSPNGGSKKTIKTFGKDSQTNLKLYEPQGLYIQVSGSPSTFYEYEDDNVKEIKGISDNQFSSFYPTFLISPTGKQTLWYEPRDGKNSVFVGDDTGKATKTIGNLSEFTPYGWYGQNDEYILLTKNGSELYISSASKVIGENGYQPVKVTDYHKTRTYPGYGYGYGGQ